MIIGGNFFKWLNFAVQAIRLLFKVFGSDEDKKKVIESEARTKSSTDDAA